MRDLSTWTRFTIATTARGRGVTTLETGDGVLLMNNEESPVQKEGRIAFRDTPLPGETWVTDHDADLIALS